MARFVRLKIFFKGDVTSAYINPDCVESILEHPDNPAHSWLTMASGNRFEIESTVTDTIYSLVHECTSGSVYPPEDPDAFND